MTISQLTSKINDYQKNTSISEEERKQSISIFKLEIERQKYNELISHMKTNIQKLRLDIIKKLTVNYSTYGDEEKEKAYNIICQFEFSERNIFDSDATIYKKEKFSEIDSNILNDKHGLYFDDEVQKMLEQGRKLEKSFHDIIDRKYLKINDVILNLLGNNFYKTDADGHLIYKENIELEKNFVYTNRKVNSLNISAGAKGILKNIILDITTHGTSQGEIHNIPQIDVNLILNHLENNQIDEDLFNELEDSNNNKSI